MMSADSAGRGLEVCDLEVVFSTGDAIVQQLLDNWLFMRCVLRC